MTKSKEYPSLRFSGFTDAWEQRKLEDFGEATGGTSLEAEFVENGKFKVINIGSYSEDSTYRDQGLRVNLSEKTKNRLLNRGDLTMILNDKTASGNIIGRVLLIEESNCYVYNQRTERIAVNSSEYDSLFLYTMLNAPNIRSKIIKQCQGNTQIYVNWSAISKLSYLVPNIDEQKKTGQFFKTLDNLITLHQRKLENVQNIKKSCLQKMFPKNGEILPEVRFPEFSGAWELRKLSDISNKVTQKNKDCEFSETLTNSAEFGIISQNDFFDHRVSNEDNINGYYIVGDNDFVYNPRISTSAPVGPINRNKLGRTGVMSPLYTVFKPHDVDYSYLEWFFKSSAWHSFMRFNGDSGARSDRFSIKDNVFFTMPIPLPTLKEQRKIGQFFQSIDNLITLHHRKLENLQNIKKGLLQQMFI